MSSREGFPVFGFMFLLLHAVTLSQALVLPDNALTRPPVLYKKLHVNRSIMRQCKAFRDRSLRVACHQIARSPVFSENGMAFISNDDYRLREEELFDETESERRVDLDQPTIIRMPSLESTIAVGVLQDSSKLRGSTTLGRIEDINSRRLPGPKEMPSECTFDGSSHNRRSTSPWTYVMHIDPHRFPQKINFAKCICKGCVNIGTGKEDLSLLSQEIKTQETVLIKNPNVVSFDDCTKKTCTRMILDIPIGCHCYVPN